MASLGAIAESGHALAANDAPLGGGDAWLGDNAVNASVAEGYSVQIPVIGVISATARSLVAEPRGLPALAMVIGLWTGLAAPAQVCRWH